ncbi:hypothetical protein BRADI_1g21466v3 [Brachypodium distachyon]|uniref:Uncharacterized protein n=1 Tax=Brachypodium distachyon TaxID=15368 RepID=A0A2K2DKF0_BRADI|nr:hypothetical protein BRADI_1g21466v3 [Brachypodium distachyon]
MSDTISAGSLGAEQLSWSDMALSLASFLKRLNRASPSSGSYGCNTEAGFGIISCSPAAGPLVCVSSSNPSQTPEGSRWPRCSASELGTTARPPHAATTDAVLPH